MWPVTVAMMILFSSVWSPVELFEPAEVAAPYNVFADQLFANLRTKSSAFGLGPLPLTYITGNFTPTTYFPYDGLTLTNGKLRNWLALKWSNESQLYFGSGAIFVAIQANFTNLQVEYDLKASEVTPGDPLNGTVQGFLKLTVIASIMLDSKTLVCRKNTIEFDGQSHIRYSIEGQHVPGFYKEFILRHLLQFSNEIVKTVETVIANTFETFVENQFPQQVTSS